MTRAKLTPLGILTYSTRTRNKTNPAHPRPASSTPVKVYDEGYYVAVIAMADEADKWGHCFNCGKEGHRWAECTKPLKDSLKQAKEWANRKKQSLKN